MKLTKCAFIPGQGWFTPRPTGVSIMDTDFRPCAYPKVINILQQLLCHFLLPVRLGNIKIVYNVILIFIIGRELF